MELQTGAGKLAPESPDGGQAGAVAEAHLYGLAGAQGAHCLVHPPRRSVLQVGSTQKGSNGRVTTELGDAIQGIHNAGVRAAEDNNNAL